MSRAEIRRKFDEIVAFAEVEKFLDTPVKRYSSGMYVRLAFAVAAHLEPEILIVDEVLAVGDAEFQKKCLGKMEEVADGAAAPCCSSATTWLRCRHCAAPQSSSRRERSPLLAGWRMSCAAISSAFDPQAQGGRNRASPWGRTSSWIPSPSSRTIRRRARLCPSR